jgi:hypothetical protein
MPDETMDIDMVHSPALPEALDLPQAAASPSQPPPPAPTPVLRDNFRDIQVKVHLRTPGKDSWSYQGRAVVQQEILGHSSRVVVRPLNGGKPLTVFSDASDLQAEKRGNFVVIGCVEHGRVISWSLNALNNTETIRLLASIELACYKCKSVTDPRSQGKSRRKIERLIKDDRRKRHRRRKDQEAMIDAFARQNLTTADQPSQPPDDTPLTA